MFKVIRIVWNNKDQPTSGLYCILKPTTGHPYWELLYHKPERTIYLQGNVKIINAEQRPASDAICKANQIVSTPEDNSSLSENDNPYNYLRKKGAPNNEQT